MCAEGGIGLSAVEVLGGVWGELAERTRAQPISEEQHLWTQLEDRLDPTELRPKLAEDVEIKEFQLRWGQNYAMLANPRELIYLRLDPQQLELVRLMDGRRTVKEIVVERFQESGDLEIGGLVDLVLTLYAANFLDKRYIDVDAGIERVIHPESNVRKRARKLVKEQTIDWFGADRFVRSFYNRVMKWAFTRGGKILTAALFVFGVVAFAFVAHSGRYSISGKSLASGALILLALDYVSVFVHEMSHAGAIIHHGRRIKGAGWQIYFGSPAFFVDSVDAVMLEPKKRIWQAVAGPYGEAVLSGIPAIILLLVPHFPMSDILYRFAVLGYLVVFMNLVPLLELDGYWILSDLIQVPDLRPRSIAFIRHDLWRKLRERARLSIQEVGLGLYGIAGFLFSAWCLYIGFYFWRQIFGSFIARLWNGGIGTRLLLALLVLLIAAPAVRGLINALRAVSRRAQAIYRGIAFRFETKWRVEAAELIDALPLFDDVPADILSDLAGRVKLRAAARGQPVVRQGERADAFYVVRRGTLEVIEENPETGKERLLRVLGRGEAFGELGLMEGAPRAATVRALEESELFEIDKGTFERLLKEMAAVPTFAPTLQATAELRELPSFAHLEADELLELLEHGEWVNFGPGEMVIEQGEPGDDFYAVKSGKLGVVRDGEEIASLGPGSYFGEVALLLDTPRTASVVTVTPVRAYRLHREGFDRFLGWAFRRGTLNPQMPQGRTMHH